MIDLHTHILPGLDDGPATMDGSLALARAAAAAGTRVVVATPHVDRLHGVTLAAIPSAVEAVADAVAAAGIDLQVLPGAEIAPDRLDELDDDALHALALGGSRYLLIESPFVRGIALEPLVADLHARGHRVVLAHPERCTAFRLDPLQLARLVRAGALVSLTDGSLAGRFGGVVRSFARTLLYEGLAHDVASDAHDTVRRPPDLGSGLRRAAREMRGLDAQRTYLTQSLPEAILADARLPPQPPAPTRRRWRR